MNVVRVIYLDQNIVVDVCECMRSSKQHGRSEQRALRLQIERCVDEGLAIFPYSEVHLSETANVSDQESRTEQVSFWDKVSQRYRFHDARAVEVNQLHAVLEERPVRFSRELAIHRSPLTFEQELPDPDLEAKKQRAESFKGLAKYWAGKLTHDLSGTIRHREVDGMIRLILEDLTNFLRTGTFPLHRIFSKHNDLHSELCWHLRDQGSAEPFEDALRWLQNNALRIPALLIDFLATEYIAEQFATDAKFRRKVEKAETDHDANDVEAAAHWFPYVDYVFTDKKMATFMFPKLRKELSRKVYAFHLSANKPLLFSSRREFLKFLRDLKPAESVASVESETQHTRGAAKTLLYILRTPDRLVSRETICEEADVNAEILSGGGLRIDVHSPEKSWDDVKSYFRQFRDNLCEDGKAATLTTVDWEDHRPVIKSAFLTLGVLSMKIGDIRGELHCDLSEHS
jgi:hypothetical protein